MEHRQKTQIPWFVDRLYRWPCNNYSLCWYDMCVLVGVQCPLLSRQCAYFVLPGFVETWAAVIIGIVAGAVCYLAVWFKNKMKWDDSLDVWGVHGVGGITGTILLGCFATTKVNPAGRDGLFYGGGAFFGKQVAAVVFASFWGFAFTYGMLWLLEKFLPGGARIKAEDEDEVDHLEFGEVAYTKDHISRVISVSDINGKARKSSQIEPEPVVEFK
jgi:hypothetical protein